MKGLHKFTFILLVIGGLNWGLIGLMDLDLVQLIFGSSASLVRIVYILVGLSALSELVSHPGMCKECMAMKKGKK